VQLQTQLGVASTMAGINWYASKGWGSEMQLYRCLKTVNHLS